MDRTPFAGLTRLAPGEPLSTDDYSFQNANPTITDQLLRLAVVAHRHDGHAKLADPAVDPVLAVDAAGGTIPADLSIYVGYTLLDADGGETAMNPTPQIITTAAGLSTPVTPPTLAADVVAGTLLAGRYDYAVTVRDAVGGETALGAIASVTIPVGSPTNRIVVSGLQAIVTASAGTGWRLWRRVNGGQWNLIGDAVTNTITDDGSLPLNCNVAPPSSTGSSTNGTNRLRVTVPAGQSAQAQRFRIYASTDGTFGTPALLGDFPIAQLGEKIFTQLTLLDGSPPPASRTVQGASPIDAETQISGLQFKTSVADAAALPLINNVDGDARVTRNNYHINIWKGAPANAWVDATPTDIDNFGDVHWKAPVANAAALPDVAAVPANVDGDVRLTLDDHKLHVWAGAPTNAWSLVGAAAPTTGLLTTISAMAANWSAGASNYAADATGVTFYGSVSKAPPGTTPLAGELLFTLDAQHRPPSDRAYPVAVNLGTAGWTTGSITIGIDGTVTYNMANLSDPAINQPEIQLSGIRFNFA